MNGKKKENTVYGRRPTSKLLKFKQPISRYASLALIFVLLVPICSSKRPPPLPILPIPSARQLSWQLSEMSMFFHFGPNTFNDTEWGTGDADPAIFFPADLDAQQWVRVAKENGFSRVILTAKHHDGFCLWPSQYTDYSVRSSPWKLGNGDVVRELAEAAENAGVELGIYLSPWDRHDPCYGETIDYNEYYLGQMTELLTRYGVVKEVFLDGARGKGEKEMDYLFDTWFGVIHQHQPQLVIFSDAGPDVRWIGDETGFAANTCWSTFNRSSAKIGDTDRKFLQRGDPLGQDWVPPECDVSIRPGWFWHPSEVPKSAETLLDIYYNSVGRNCLLLLNVPPNSSGLISDEDIEVLEKFSKLRTSIFSYNLANNAIVNASSTRRGISKSQYASQNVLEESIYSYWAPEKNKTVWKLNLEFEDPVTFNVLQVREPIQMGQRIAKFHLETLDQKGHWEEVTNGTTVGYKRLLRFPTVVSHQLRFVIDESRADPLISYLAIHMDPISPFNVSVRSSKPDFNRSQILQPVLRKHSQIVSI
ncbi:Alpha-L-fucosidase [Bertholletia excelsa]